MRQDNQPLHSALGQPVTSSVVDWSDERSASSPGFPPFWHQLAESRSCRRQEENWIASYIRSMFLGCSRTTAVHHLLLLMGMMRKMCVCFFCFFSFFERACTCWGFGVFFLLCSYQASAKCLIIVTMQRCVAAQMQPVFCSLALRSSKQEVC